MYDIVIIGGGPAGVTAALRARELGASTALVERGRMGGACTNDGCVPTRVLAKAARLLRDARQFGDYGLLLDQTPAVDFAALLSRTQQIVYQLHEKKQLLDHLRDVKVDVYSEVGIASFHNPHEIRCENGQTIIAERFVLCAGGHARRLDFPGGEHALTHSDVWMLPNLPQSVVIVGGGATGCQLASIFETFGARVTIMDVAHSILLAEDTLVADTIRREFERQGMQIVTGIERVDRIEPLDERRKRLVYLKDSAQHAIETETVVLSVGWPGNVESLNLSAAGVETTASYIKVDDYLRTSAPHIYAAGDITGKMMLVQSASAQARVAVENALLDQQRKAEHRLVPHGGFTDPEYGGVGLTESQAREQSSPAVAVVPYTDMDRAIIDGHSVGFCKLIVDRDTHRLLGAHVVGEQAVEIVQIVAAGIAGRLRVEQLADLEFAYPTFSAIVGLAARQLTRELGSVALAPEWRVLAPIRGSEWERRD
jgi:pyruvate/2-oxoglutarate dehydrogenase complex dihydrolipoamide dehydrogenase (E3) component